jgi:hypothetical protein
MRDRAAEAGDTEPQEDGEDLARDAARYRRLRRRFRCAAHAVVVLVVRRISKY